MREDGRRICFVKPVLPGGSRVVLYDDMEGVLKWRPRVPGGWDRCVYSVVDAYYGNRCLESFTVVSVSNGINWKYAVRYVPNFGPDGICRLEFIFRCRAKVIPAPPLSYTEGVCGRVELCVGGIGFRFEVMVNWFDGLYLTGGPGSEYIVGFFDGVVPSQDSWHRLWLEFSVTKLVFISAGIDALSLPVFGLAPTSLGVVSSEYGLVGLGVGQQATGRQAANFDSVCLFQVW